MVFRSEGFISPLEIEGITVDIDGLLLPALNKRKSLPDTSDLSQESSSEISPQPEKTNSWFQFTRRIYLNSGMPSYIADEAVQSHKEIYGAFHRQKVIIDAKRTRGSISAGRYTELYNFQFSVMVRNLVSLWRDARYNQDIGSEGKLTKKFLSEVLDDIIEHDIVETDSIELIQYLQELHKLGVPIFILTGGLLGVAEKLSERLGFNGGYANSFLIFGGTEKDPITWDKANDDDELTGFGYDPDLSTNKIRRLFEIVQYLMKPGQLAPIQAENILSLVDGDPADEGLVQLTHLIALNPENAMVAFKAKRQVETYTEMILAIDEILPSRIKDLLPKRLSA